MALVGVLFDVSGSMQEQLEVQIRKTDGSSTRRIDAVFAILDRFTSTGTVGGGGGGAAATAAGRDEDRIFVTGFGLQLFVELHPSLRTESAIPLIGPFLRIGALHHWAERKDVCNLLGILECAAPTDAAVSPFEGLAAIFAANGAPNTLRYLSEYVTKDEAAFFRNALSNSEHQHVVAKIVPILPAICREPAGSGNWTEVFNAPNARKIVADAKRKVLDELLVPAICTAQELGEKLRGARARFEAGGAGDNNVLSRMWGELRPFIYGNTPMRMALRNTLENYSRIEATEGRYLLIISDGESTDGDPAPIARALREEGWTIFAAYLTSKSIAQPRQIFDKAPPNTNEGMRTMMDCSSRVSLESHSHFLYVLQSRGWKLPESAEGHLFLQANSVELIEEFTDLVNELSGSSDALFDIVGRVNLAEYVERARDRFEPQRQRGGTCYAHATATVLHLALSRIVGRVPPSFAQLRDAIIAKHGKDGGRVVTVLAEMCHPNTVLPGRSDRLRFAEVDERGARRAVLALRVVVASFRLRDSQWKAFGEFYKDSPKGVLTSDRLPPPDPREKLEGHAVVLIACKRNHLVFLNSWGKDFADGGMFRVKDGSVLSNPDAPMRFYDVYWTLADVTDGEKRAYRLMQEEAVKRGARALPAWVKNADFQCPLCKREAPINNYGGTVYEAECPNCWRKFKPTVDGLIQTLYGRSRSDDL
ncbi:hypothetical protein DFJ73DRAFT_961535 [Zopfochytrium polystomum]|nr:hypothetical protein DFJ73DRAFT_961535 [Zopfochytrium polystomum]